MRGCVVKPTDLKSVFAQIELEFSQSEREKKPKWPKIFEATDLGGFWW